MMRTVTANGLAAQINQEYEAAVKNDESATGLAQTALKHAAECGRLLLKAQSEVTGNWGGWVKDNLSFGERQAQKYIQFAREVRVKPELLNAGSTLDGVLKLVSDRTSPASKAKAKGTTGRYDHPSPTNGSSKASGSMHKICVCTTPRWMSPRGKSALRT